MGPFLLRSPISLTELASLSSRTSIGDGNLDIASYVGTNPVQTSILYGNGDGTFKPAVFPPSLSGFGAAYTADLKQ
jgi:hypothetical protein